jgi:hypothetical protein
VSVRTIVADNRAWRFVPDDTPPDAGRQQILLQARLIDELTGMPARAPITATTTMKDVRAAAVEGANVGLVGGPGALFALPHLPTVELDLGISASGFLPLNLVAPVGAQPDFPNSFRAIPLGDVALRRVPTQLRGRVVSRTSGPRANATVQVEGIWRQLTDTTGAAAAANFVGLWSGVYADRPAGSTLSASDLTPVAATQQLLLPAQTGATILRLSDRQGLGVGDVLAIESGDPERQEFIPIAAVDAASSPDQPADVTLAHPLRRTHRDGAAVVRAVPGASGPANALTDPARAGDVTVFLAGLTGLGAATRTVVLAGGTVSPEYHGLGLYAAQSGGEGDFVLPPLHRVAQLRLRAEHAAEPQPARIDVALDWGASELVRDLVFP